MKKPWDHERLHHKTFTRVIIKKKISVTMFLVLKSYP